jgi:hypothetical protein
MRFPADSTHFRDDSNSTVAFRINPQQLGCIPVAIFPIIILVIQDRHKKSPAHFCTGLLNIKNSQASATKMSDYSDLII